MESIILAIIFPTLSYITADNVDLNYGVGYSDSISIDPVIFHGEVVARYKYFNIKFKHESSIKDTDDNFGQNSIVIFKTVRIK